mmetsp:Transcript_5907/g.11270  ORF Transcript_5907/g.11270 Transcript_5907/m.11270 type:complete len:117 (-) Transcript_5907:60-410(-)
MLFTFLLTLNTSASLPTSSQSTTCSVRSPSAPSTNVILLSTCHTSSHVAISDGDLSEGTACRSIARLLPKSESVENRTEAGGNRKGRTFDRVYVSAVRQRHRKLDCVLQHKLRFRR